MLKLRILTALILIPLVIVGIFYLSQLAFMKITALITVLAAWEWSRLSGWNELKNRCFFIGFQTSILLSLMAFSSPASWLWMMLVGLLFWIILSFYLLNARKQPILPKIHSTIRACLGWLILTLCWVALQWLHLNPFYLLFMLLIIWLGDTAAYVSGRLWGEHLLAPTLSPKKTWEGMLIGIVVTCFAAMLIQTFFTGVKPYIWKTLLLVLLTSFASIIGDLFESLLKRMEGLKDSGHLLPGHGGILDRIDSLLAAAPVFAGSLLLLDLVS